MRTIIITMSFRWFFSSNIPYFSIDFNALILMYELNDSALVDDDSRYWKAASAEWDLIERDDVV